MSTLAMVCNWDDKYKDFEDIILPNRRKYASHNNYPLLESNHPTHWGKIIALLSAWENHDYLWWLDFDAVMTNKHSVDNLLDGRFVISCDFHGLNSGSFIVPTTEEFRQILVDGLSMRDYYDTVNGFHDQNAFGFLLWKANEKVRVVDQSVLNSYPLESGGNNHWKCGDLVLHCPGTTMEARKQILASHLDELDKVL